MRPTPRAAVVTAPAPIAPLPPGPALVVHAGRDLGPVQRRLLGANFEHISARRPEIATLAGTIPFFRFPGGDDRSAFEWDRPDPGTCARPRWTWPDVAELARARGIGMMLETNVVRGDAEDAVKWVLDARRRGIDAPWVCVGNEPWGNWDAGFRTAADYARNVRDIADALRREAPGARVVLEIGTFNEDAWNREAVRRTADVIDAVDTHYYPNHQDHPDPLSVAAGADGIGPLVERVRAMLRDEAGERAAHIGVILGEWDGASDPPRPGPPQAGRAYAQWSMPNALFYGVAPGEMMLAGVEAAFFYQVQGYRFGAVGGHACLEADVRVMRPKWLVMSLWIEHFVGRLVAVESIDLPTFHSDGPTNWDGFRGTAPYVRAYAARRRDRLVVLATNRHPTEVASVTLDLRDFVPAARAHTWRVAGDSMMATNENVGGPADAVHIERGTMAVPSARFALRLPAHSVSVLRFDAQRAPR